jgi:peptide/nickel transport system substrate-binding protein
VHSYDKEKGYGRYNGGRYANAKVDQLIEDSAGVLDKDARLDLLRQAMQIALVEDMNVIPLHYQVDLYAYSKKINFDPRADTYLFFYDISFK